MKNCDPLVSVIVPIYNVEKYLSKCLESILNQTCTNFELICVNDGSTDNSEKILTQYQEKDRRIKVINKVNGGVSSARNAGLDVATGAYVTFVDSDDWIEVDTIELTLSAIEGSTEIDYVSWIAQIEVEESLTNLKMIKGAENYHALRLTGRKEITSKVIEDRTVTVWNKLFKRSIVEKINLRFPNGLLYEDNYFFILYAMNAKMGVYLDAPLYHYLQRSSSIMGMSKKKEKIRKYDRTVVFSRLYESAKASPLFKEAQPLLIRYFKAWLKMDFRECSDSHKEEMLKFAENFVDKEKDPSFNSKTIKNIRQRKWYKIRGIKPQLAWYENLFSIKTLYPSCPYKVLRVLGVQFKI